METNDVEIKTQKIMNSLAINSEKFARLISDIDGPEKYKRAIIEIYEEGFKTGVLEALRVTFEHDNTELDKKIFQTN